MRPLLRGGGISPLLLVSSLRQQDLVRAIRLARYNATAWGYKPDRIAVMGYSAGGHLASEALVHFWDGDAGSADPIERVSSRPDLGVLCYAVITMRGARRD